MKKATRIVLVIATICLAAGIVLSGIAFAIAGFDPQRLSTTEPYTKQQFFTSQDGNTDAIIVKGLSEDIAIVPTTDDKIEVEYYENNTQTFSIEERNGILEIIEEHRPFLSIFNFNFGSHNLIIKVPEDFAGALDLESASGDVSLSIPLKLDTVKTSLQSGNFTCTDLNVSNSFEVSTTSGSISLSNISSKSFSAISFSGDIRTRDLIEVTQLELSTTSGRIEAGNLVGQNVALSSASGDIAVRSLGATKVEVVTTSGNIDLHSLASNETILRSMSGDIKAFAEGVDSDYRIDTSTMSGSIRTPSGNSAAEKILTAETTSGNITFTFDAN